jgi:hypothetical protein
VSRHGAGPQRGEEAGAADRHGPADPGAMSRSAALALVILALTLILVELRQLGAF